MKAVLALIAVGLLGAASSATLPKKSLSLPPYVKTCRREQPDFDSCLLTSLQKLVPRLVKGIPELELPPFDPFELDERVFEYSNGHIQGKTTIKDSMTYGLSGIQFLDVRTDFKNEDDINIQIDAFVPKVKSDGKYKVQGKFLGSDLGSAGSYEVSLTNVSDTWNIHGALVTVDGEKYLKITKIDSNPEIGDMKIYASDLFNGNKELTKIALDMFNQNWRLIYNEIRPYVRGSHDKEVIDMANRVLLRIPFDQIFPGSS